MLIGESCCSVCLLWELSGSGVGLAVHLWTVPEPPWRAPGIARGSDRTAGLCFSVEAVGAFQPLLDPGHTVGTARRARSHSNPSHISQLCEMGLSSSQGWGRSLRVSFDSPSVSDIEQLKIIELVILSSDGKSRTTRPSKETR